MKILHSAINLVTIFFFFNFLLPLLGWLISPYCHRHFGSGDIMYLAVEKEDSTCSFSNPALVIISKEHGRQHVVLKSDSISY